MDPSLSTSSSKAQKVKYAVIFLLIVILLDFCASIVLKNLHQKLDRGEFGLLNKIINNADEEVLIFGSSRAKYHYDSLVIEAASGKSCYNAGFNGRGILLSKALTGLLLRNSRPSAIVLDINFMDHTYQEEYKKLDILRPFYSEFPEVKEVLDFKAPFEKIRHLSFSYPYNATVPAFIERKIDKNEADKRKGSLSVKGTLLKNFVPEGSASEKVLDEDLLQALYDICDLCKQKNVKLIVCISPSLHRFNPDSLNHLHENLEAKGIEFHDFSSSDDFKSPKIFYDKNHLNEFGAKFYSKRIGNIIKSSLNQ